MDRKSWGLSVGAVFFHGIFLALSFLLMPEYGDALLIAGMVAGGAFFLLWGIVGWRARRILPPFLFFAGGAALQIALNVLGVVPEDSGWFAGLHQMFYILLLGVQALAVGVESVGIWGIRRRKERRKS